MRKIVFLAVLAALVVPAAGLAATPNAADRSHAQRDCRALKDQLGVATFRQTYGSIAAKGRNAFGKCVSRWSMTEATNRVNAARQCRSERSADAAAFAEAYGPTHAFGNCVASKRRAASRADRRATVKAAHTCKASRGEDSDAFAAQWGTGKNAFGKCVASTARNS